MHLADIPATLTITNVLNETLVIATSIRLEPLEADAVIRMAGRGRGNKSDIYRALFIAEQMGHIEAGGLSPLTDPVSSGHTLFGGQDPMRDVEPEGRAGVLGIHTGAPTVGRPALLGIADLTPLGIATGAPTVGAPALLGIADLTPLGIAAGAPTVGAPVLRGVTALTPLGIATGAPTVGSPELVDVPAVVEPPTWIEYDDTYNAEPPDNDVTRALGTGPFTNVAASFWLKTDDAAHLFMRPVFGNGANNSTIEISIDAGSIWYYETSDNGNVWEHNWSAAIPTDGRWHHYAVKAGYCWIDGLPVTFADSGTGEDPGSSHPSITGDATIMRILLLSGKKSRIADMRIFKIDSDVQAQAVYGSPLLDDGATTIVGAWRMGDGPGAGTAFDRSVKAAPLDVVTGMTWGGVKDTRILVVGWDCGSVFVSHHTGDDWTTPIASGEWGCCAMDKTGQYQITGAGIDFPGELKVSTDYGATWVTRLPGGDANQGWDYGCAVSGDGSVMLACGDSGFYESTDHGANWTTLNPGGTGVFYRTAADSDGSVLAVIQHKTLWFSANGGTSWSSRVLDINGGWNCRVALSDDGSVIVLGYEVGISNPVGTVDISTNSGVTWSTHSLPLIGMMGVACNADGSVIVVGGQDHLLTSSDGGATWTERQPAGDTNHLWSGFTVSADGKTITAFNYDSKGYRSFDGGENWTEITPPDAVSGGFYDAAGSRS